LSVERSRKHGPFDLRYPPIRHKPAPASLWRVGEDSTDWEGFRARFFPGCRRHDLDALAAYESYRNDVDGAVHIPRSDNAQRVEDEEEPPAAAGTERWEGEGGAIAVRRRRTRRGERPVGTHAKHEPGA
jgi:hypothetical protein